MGPGNPMDGGMAMGPGNPMMVACRWAWSGTSFLQLKFRSQFVSAVLPLAQQAVGAAASKGGSKGGKS